MGHVFARLAGHGLVLLPYWPYTFERHGDGSDAVAVTHLRPECRVRAVVDPLAAHSVPGVVDVEPGPDHPYWVIETSHFNAAWPAGFSITSDFEPFCLIGEHGTSIHVQGPAYVADPDALIASDQTVVARRAMDQGVQVLELAYEYEGEPWWKGVYFLPRADGRVLAFSAQSREPGIAAARNTVEWMLGLK